MSYILNYSMIRISRAYRKKEIAAAFLVDDEKVSLFHLSVCRLELKSGESLIPTRIASLRSAKRRRIINRSTIDDIAVVRIRCYSTDDTVIMPIYDAFNMQLR